MAENSFETCNCDLRDRKWDPNTHKCGFCSRIYIDYRYTVLIAHRNQVINNHGKLIASDPVLSRFLAKRGDWELWVGADKELDETCGGNEIWWERWKVSPSYARLEHQHCSLPAVVIKESLLVEIIEKLAKVRRRKKIKWYDANS